MEAFRADVAEGNAKLDRLKDKLQELALQKQEANGAIEEAQRAIHVQKNSTRAEVFRLKGDIRFVSVEQIAAQFRIDELASLEDLHLWRATKIQPDLLEFIYASTYKVSIPCLKFQPLVEQLDVKRLDSVKTKVKDAFPHLTDFMSRMATQRVAQVDGTPNARKV